MKNIQESIKHIKGIKEQIGIFTTTITQTQTRISAMEKDVYKNNLMENKVKQLEKYNMEMEKSMSEKFDEPIYLLKNRTSLASLMTLNVLFVRNISEIQHF